MKKLSFDEFYDYMSEHIADNVEGIIIYTEDSFSEQYSLESRSYKVHSSAKYFNPELCGSSLFGTSLDGTDVGVRLDYYSHWKVEYCYIIE